MLYLDSLLPTVRSALCDKEADVRVAAAQTFDSLHSTLGECMYVCACLRHAAITTCTVPSIYVCPIT